LSQDAYDELMAVVDFTQKPTIESLEAKITLRARSSGVSEREIMLTDAEQILQSALALPDIDRAAIVESLLTSLDQPDAVIDEIWAAEAEARLAAFDAGTMKAIPAAEVFNELGGCRNAAERQDDNSLPLFLALCCWLFGGLWLLGVSLVASAVRDGLGPNSVESHGWLALARFWRAAHWSLLPPAALFLVGCGFYWWDIRRLASKFK
jgi:putative addiction module component (TIGR02574 family)